MNFQWLFDRPISHRGLHDAEYPENSLPAFAKAVEHGFNIEIDVHLTKDKHLVIFHDTNLKRVCGVKKALKKCTLAELKTYRLCGTEYTIPTLEEFLQLVDGKVGILCEIKGVNPCDHSIVKATIKALENYKGNIALQSFNFGAVKYARKHCDLPVGGLYTWCSPSTKNPRWCLSAWMGKLWLVRSTKAQFISYDVRACASNLSENKWLKKWSKKLPVINWTVDTKERVADAQKYANNMIFEYLDPAYVEECVGTFRPLDVE
ncbi:MAG: hypothetical protein NC037_02385 [Bacteroides sp.]|nr:hypothetical protein [Bacillota bacterium]MCM1393712.1 hypothetical protein [[Eubacterium] siraeum]MCM1455363.1 hypothetical protein [Bacteroides sp.]